MLGREGAALEHKNIDEGGKIEKNKIEAVKKIN